MARFYPSGGTGGADVSVVTAMADDVAKGKVIVGPDGNPLTGELELTGTAADSQVLTGQTYYNTDLHEKRTGAMANQGAWNSEGLAAGKEVVIPAGYHNGGGKVTAKDLTSQTPGDATAAQIWAGRKAWVNGQQVMGTLVTQGGSTTIPGTAAKTIVTPNKIVTGNIVVAGDPNLIPANVKKGVPIFGVMGIAEGYFPTATDLYLRGQNLKLNPSFSSKAKFEAGAIYVTDANGDMVIETNQEINLSPYTKLNMEVYVQDYNDVRGLLEVKVGPSKIYFDNTQWIQFGHNGKLTNVTWSFDISKVNVSTVFHIGFYYNVDLQIFRIWLS